MAILVADCPRCSSQQMTFDAHYAIPAGIGSDWQRYFEVFCQCRHCSRSTVFVIALSVIKSFGTDGRLI